MWRPERGHNRRIDKSGWECFDRDPDPDPAAFVPGTKKKNDVTCSAGRDLHAKTLWRQSALRCASKMYASFSCLATGAFSIHTTSHLRWRDMSHLQSPKSQPRNGGFSLFFPCYHGEFRRIARDDLVHYPTVQFSTSSHGNPTLHTHVNSDKAKIPLHGADGVSAAIFR